MLGSILMWMWWGQKHKISDLSERTKCKSWAWRSYLGFWEATPTGTWQVEAEILLFNNINQNFQVRRADCYHLYFVTKDSVGVTQFPTPRSAVEENTKKKSDDKIKRQKDFPVYFLAALPDNPLSDGKTKEERHVEEAQSLPKTLSRILSRWSRSKPATPS